MDDDAPPLEPFPEDWERALCIAAHPDDLEYGAASAVAAWTAAGKDVAYTLVTSGEAGIDGVAPQECGPRRRSEEIAGAAASRRDGRVPRAPRRHRRVRLAAAP